MNKNDLSYSIIHCAMTVHNELGNGFLEKVYQLSLKHELKIQGINSEAEKKIDVFFKGVLVGEYYADLFVENQFIVETKCVNRLIKPHIMQIKHYLIATGMKNGLLFNFDNPKLEWHRIYR